MISDQVKYMKLRMRPIGLPLLAVLATGLNLQGQSIANPSSLDKPANTFYHPFTLAAASSPRPL